MINQRQNDSIPIDFEATDHDNGVWFRNYALVKFNNYLIILYYVRSKNK